MTPNPVVSAGSEALLYPCKLTRNICTDIKPSLSSASELKSCTRKCPRIFAFVIFISFFCNCYLSLFNIIFSEVTHVFSFEVKWRGCCSFFFCFPLGMRKNFVGSGMIWGKWRRLKMATLKARWLLCIITTVRVTITCFNIKVTVRIDRRVDVCVYYDFQNNQKLYSYFQLNSSVVCIMQAHYETGTEILNILQEFVPKRVKWL